jgi:hypothetical protein
MTIATYKGLTILFTEGVNPCIKIAEAYKLKTSEEINAALDFILSTEVYKDLQAAGFTRTRRSMLNEWKAHNLLHRLGVMRERTGCVDIDQNEPKWRRAIYALLSIF